MSGYILVISGPSGAGKSTILSNVFKRLDNLYFSISSTSRQPRGAEKDGVDYHFLSQEEFKKDIADGYFLEWANVHGNYYGTSLRYIQDALDAGKIAILDIDVQGHKIIREKLGDKISSVFLTTPTAKVLNERLSSRATDSKEAIQKRLENAKEEIKRINEYDFLLINETIEKTTQDLTNIIKSCAHKRANLDGTAFADRWIYG